MKKIENLKTFEDACKVLKLDAKSVIPDFSCYPKNDRKSMVAHAKLVIIVKAANKIENGGKQWKPNWKDANEYKYEIWFDMGSSASGFSYDVYDYWNADSIVGSRLCFKSRELAEYAGKQFVDVYRDFMIIK